MVIYLLFDGVLLLSLSMSIIPTTLQVGKVWYGTVPLDGDEDEVEDECINRVDSQCNQLLLDGGWFDGMSWNGEYRNRYNGYRESVD